MTTPDYKAQLEQVRKTIARIEGGDQEIRVRERYLTDPALETLYRRERKLEKMVARQGSTDGPQQIVLHRRRRRGYYGR